MKKLFFYMVAAAIALTSCSSEDVVEVNNNGNAIDFRVAMEGGANSRGVETLNTNLRRFYVTAILNDGAGVNYFTDVLYSSNSDGHYLFKGDDEYMWPSEGAIKFYAYSYGLKIEKDQTTFPIDKTLFGTVSITNEGQTFSGFAPQSEVNKQIDFVTAIASGTRAENQEDGVNLTFNHALSQIQVRARNGHSLYNYEVYGVKIANVISKDNFDMGENKWDNAKDNEDDSKEFDMNTYTITYSKPVKVNAETNGIDIMESDGTENGPAMLIPQKLSGCEIDDNDVADAKSGAYIGVLMRVTMKDSGNQVYPNVMSNKSLINVGTDDEGNPINCAWAIIPISTDWLIGHKYIYILDFSHGAGFDEGEGFRIFDGVVMFTTEMSGWADADDSKNIKRTQM